LIDNGWCAYSNPRELCEPIRSMDRLLLLRRLLDDGLFNTKKLGSALPRGIGSTVTRVWCEPNLSGLWCRP
jgi:hypothetical protein